MLGAASGMVAGLVAVTPAAGFVGPLGAIVLGVIAAACCYFFVQVVKERFGYDDSLDVFGVHGIGGIVGADRHRLPRLHGLRRRRLRRGREHGRRRSSPRSRRSA